jgi:hypothetical protein
MKSPIISSSAMPEQKLPPYPDGANSPMTAGIIAQQQNAELQNARNKIGGSKYRKTKHNKRKYKGGATPVVQVPAVPSGTVNQGATNSNYKDITSLAQQQQTDMIFDSAQKPSDTALLSAKQQALYSGKTGGSKRNRMTYKRNHNKKQTNKRHVYKRKGGSYPVWGCLSGGRKRTKRHRK